MSDKLQVITTVNPVTHQYEDRIITGKIMKENTLLITEEEENDNGTYHRDMEMGEKEGWRVWRVRTFEDRVWLTSFIWSSHYWGDDIFEAKKTERFTHICPSKIDDYKYVAYEYEDVMLGIYAWKTEAEAKRYATNNNSSLEGTVIGTVYLWGDMVEHVRGWRATHARIKELVHYRGNVSPANFQKLKERYESND